MEFCIDRLLENFAICENRQTKEMLNIKLELLPKNVKVNDIIKLENDKYVIDEKATLEAKERIKQKARSLWKN